MPFCPRAVSTLKQFCGGQTGLLLVARRSYRMCSRRVGYQKLRAAQMRRFADWPGQAMRQTRQTRRGPVSALN